MLAGKDECKDVRYKLVASFHEVVGIVEPADAMKYLLPAFKELLKDTDPAIALRIATSIDVTIKHFLTAECAVKKAEDEASGEGAQLISQVNDDLSAFDETYVNLLQQLLIEQDSKHSWRVKVLLLSAIGRYIFLPLN